MSRFYSPSAFVFYGLFAFLIVATLIARTLIRRGKVGGDTARNLMDRIWAWWVMIGVLALIFTLGATAITVFFALCSVAALREFATITHTRRADHDALAVAFYVVLPLQYLLVWLHVPIFATLLIPVYCFLLLPVVTVFKGEVKDFLTRVSETQWGLMVCVYCVSHIPAILQLDIPGYRYSAFTLVAWLILVVQASDVLQYVWGKSLGRHLLAPRVSPSKTVEGLLGGMLSASLLGMALAGITPFAWWQAGLVALVVTTFGFLGGLIMSAIKRDRGVKDWGTLVQGHGGILDRLDSLVFSAPVFLHILAWGWL
ncbi:phosphatidate cytidylyltransferase [Paracoccus lutimaris]|uniref:Phosphatidate cytidylyltransferase n=1 Tax=Paracoccus lutimaris TaxID=1490030 RepID=A0A368Z8C9_9RHOB|nr:phosphatidate cytidylyltransferase [Paracoccus lutimaris]MBP8931543.1 phosphatidate cytidylyltransferase [Paracoccus sp. (in: a-proteobacteria)]RCW88259.1 phosphatidate cytidylyltransferase [Paracoccus lutimaris]